MSCPISRYFQFRIASTHRIMCNFIFMFSNKDYACSRVNSIKALIFRDFRFGTILVKSFQIGFFQISDF